MKTKMNPIKIDRNEEQIIINSGFAKMADRYGSKEYRMLQKCRDDYPTFKVITRTINKKPNKESYKGLTYDYMRSYIEAHCPNPTIALAYFEELLLRGKCRKEGYTYGKIKKWFLNTFPEVKEIIAEGELLLTTQNTNLIENACY